MVGIKDVARQAGVSVGTVSNVINRPDMVSADTRARVLEVIDELGYVRSESARQLRAGRSRIIALLVLDMANPFFVEVASGAERAARETGLGVMLCNSAESPAEEAAPAHEHRKIVFQPELVVRSSSLSGHRRP